MKKIVLLSSLLLIINNIQAIKVRFDVSNMSVNVAEGSIGVFTFFEIYPDDFEFQDSIFESSLLNLPDINYNTISSIVIQKTMLGEKFPPNFVTIGMFSVNDTIAYGKLSDEDFVQGNTYAYRLVAVTYGNQNLNLTQKSISVQIAAPEMNCAKLNNVYRLAGHNNYQNNIFPWWAGGYYQTLFYTRVVELDVHKSNNPSTWNWDVGHVGSGNKNNCGHTTVFGNKPFGICIDDLKTWHNDHPNHDPIILFIDLKSDWNYGGNQTPFDLDQKLLALVPNPQDIYKPRDLLGNSLSSNPGNMRLAAQQNNWPSMGDLTGKLMFVLTGDGPKINQYIADRSTGAIAFSAAKVNNNIDVNDLTRTTPSIAWWAANDIVFYNEKRSKDLNVGLYTSNLNYITRVWNSTTFGSPKVFTNAEYEEAINFGFNNIAVRDIYGNYNPGGKPVNYISYMPAVTYPGLVNNHIYSTYQNVTQAAIHNIVATDLTVEAGTHYRMIAGNSIDLQNNVDIKAGSDVDIRIDNCWDTDYSQRQQEGEQLTQDEIDALMHELDKELYGYTPKDEEEIVSLTVYPNPTPDIH